MKQKTIVITGAASGIGRSCAKSLFTQQHKLILIDIQQAALEDTKKELLASSPFALPENTVITIAADLSCLDGLNTVKAVLEPTECIDGLIHCAGLMGEYGRCHEMKLDHFDLVMKHQCYSAFHASHVVLGKMCEKKGGSIVLVGGAGGTVALSHLPAYTTALHGVSGLVKSLALDYGKDNIRVNGVLPAATQTPLYKKSQGSNASSRMGSLMKSAVPLGKVASAQEVTAVILFLMSEEASHVSGALVPVDGGFTVY